MVVESDTLNRHSMTLADITFLNATEDHNKQSEDDPVTVRQEFVFFQEPLVASTVVASLTKEQGNVPSQRNSLMVCIR